MINKKRVTKEMLLKTLEEKDLEIADLKQRAIKKIEGLQGDIQALENRAFALEKANTKIRDELSKSISKEFCLQLVGAMCNKNEQIF